MIRFKTQGNGLIPMNLTWWKPTKEEWVPVLLDDHPAFWKKEADPTTGRPWAQLNPPYAAWKAKRYPGQPLLRATGTMLDSAYIFTRGNQFIVRSTDYGAYNQFGTSKMPARPWMGVPDISLEQIVPISWKNILSRKR
jgi:phage gpG-like protein